MSKRPKPKQTRKGAKRGPKEERLHLPDVQIALDGMWTAKPKKKAK